MKKTLYLLLFLCIANFAKSQSIIYVDLNATGNSDGSSWTNAFTTISDGLLLATENDEVWVAKGTYTPSVPATYTVPLVLIDEGVKLIGGFDGTETSISDRDITKIHTDNATIITGDYNGDDISGDLSTNKNDNAPNLIRLSANNTTIDGVILQNAYTPGHNPIIVPGTNKYNFTIANTIIKDNFAEGVFFDWRVFSGDLIIKNTSIINNKANNGLMLIQLSNNNGNSLNSYLVNVLFANNNYHSDFGAIWFRQVSGSSHTGNHTLTNCTFVNNVNVHYQPYRQLINVSGDGNNNINIYNSVFWDNKYQTTNISDYDIFNSKISEGDTHNVTIKNSIIKLPAEIDRVTDGTIVTEDLSTTNPNLDSDYLPTATSSAVIDQGDNTFYSSTYPTTDLAGNNRIDNTTIDLGAYEYSISCSDIITIPDNNFETALLNHDPVIDSNGDDLICRDEAEAFTGTLNLYNKNISDLTGIEAFTNITGLLLTNNALTTINVSQNTALEYLWVKNNNLSSINISQNTALEYFSCEENQITALDLSANNQIAHLSCFSNQLTSLDVSNVSSLSRFLCYDNELTSLNVSSNTNLTELYVSENNLTSLDLSLNSNLKSLECNDNQLTTLDLSNGNNSNMIQVWAYDNPDLTCIKVDAGFTPSASWQKDVSANFNENCGTITDVEDHFYERVSIYPNPAKDYIVIQSQEKIQSVILYTVAGAEVMRTTQDKMSLTDLPNGLYIVKVISNKNEVAVKRIFKK